jgi:hypothetical protein
VVGSTAALNEREQRSVAPLLRVAAGEHPWPTEISEGRMGHFGSKPVPVILVEPELVVEVDADTAFEHRKWRHVVSFIRPQPDLTPDDVVRLA